VAQVVDRLKEIESQGLFDKKDSKKGAKKAASSAAVAGPAKSNGVPDSAAKKGCCTVM